MAWIWIGILILFLALLLLSSIQIRIYYKRESEDDRIKVVIGLINGLIPIRIKIPSVKVKPQGIQVEENLQTPNATINEEMHRFTIQDIKKYREAVAVALEKVENLRKIIRNFMAKIKIVKLTWNTRIGTGDAAETGILSGIVWGVKSGIITLLSHFLHLRTTPDVTIEPSFMQACLYTEFECIVQFRVGNAILAGILIFIHLRKGRKVR